tara:strand:- start:1509 stop:2327 length:819 start_codon:yes stop_codon:yes gene_type:complete
MANKKKDLIPTNVEQSVKQDLKKEVIAVEKTPANSWEMKDRVYVLKHGLSPLTYTLRGSGIYFFDEELGYERELKLTSNQRTPFVDEFKGDHRVAHITFEDGVLNVPKNKQTLQKLLSLYHPDNGVRYVEFDSVKKAVDQVSMIELEIEALMAASAMDIDTAEAVMRVELGSKVSKMSSKELKRDLLLYAKRNPSLFLELANDDNVFLRNVGIKAVEMNLIKLSPDQRTFSSGSGRKLMTVPFNEHPYSALAAWFKTDEGMEVYSTLEKQLN